MLKSPVFSLTKLGAACAAVAALSMAQPVFAQNPAPAPAAAESAANRSPELTLQATASSEVKQDTVSYTHLICPPRYIWGSGVPQF